MRRGDRSAQGFTFVAVLVLLATLATGLAVVGPSWTHELRRDRERELMRIGLLYAEALARYRDLSPGSLKQGPATLEELTSDTRYVGTMRHLRRLYPDPISGGRWVEVRDEAKRIVAVRSASDDEPIARGSVVLNDRVLPPAVRYSDWLFLAQPLAQSPARPPL